MKTCSFFGHRNTPQTEEIKQAVRERVERLIVEEGVNTFLFGSRSKFDELCHIVVTELRTAYPHIRRIAYLCKHETACLVGKGEKTSAGIKRLTGKDCRVEEYEEIKKSDRINEAGKAAYVERNQWMIDESDFVLVKYRECVESGGTKLAYRYAVQKGKKIFLYNEENKLFVIKK